MIVDTIALKRTSFSIDIHLTRAENEDSERVLRILEGILANTLLLHKTQRIIIGKRIKMDQNTFDALKREFPNIYRQTFGGCNYEGKRKSSVSRDLLGHGRKYHLQK